MIISASRRTDIPAFYFEWFLERLRQGYALIPNPRNPNRLGRVELCPDKVDCIVFWTKNPIPMLGKLRQLEEMGYSYYTQFTLTPYREEIESGLPSKEKLMEAFINLAEKTSPQQVVWRYDPIFIDDNHTVEWHIERFHKMCEVVGPYTKRCIISFIDSYKSISHKFRSMTQSEITAVASGVSDIAKEHSISLFTCAEEIDLEEHNIEHSACIDRELIGEIIDFPISGKKDGNQRPACCCVESVDIGVYDTCPNGCSYCYATSSQKTVLRRVAEHDSKAPMLTGYPRGDEIITDRTSPSQKIDQLSLFNL